MPEHILNDLITKVEMNPLITNCFHEFGEGIPEDQFDDLEEEFSVSIPDVIKKVYSQFNGFRLKWEYHDEKLAKRNDFVEGSIRILKFQDMMIGFDGRAWQNVLWTENMPASALLSNKRLKVFDYYATDSVECVCIYLSPSGELIPKLWLYYHGADPLELEIPFERYFDFQFKTKGIWGWQYLFTNIRLTDKRNSAIKTNCELIIEEYGKIFPDGFEKELKQRYQKLKQLK